MAGIRRIDVTRVQIRLLEFSVQRMRRDYDVSNVWIERDIADGDLDKVYICCYEYGGI